jgi:DNA-binding NarL/FixJ family response regulator
MQNSIAQQQERAATNEKPTQAITRSFPSISSAAVSSKEKVPRLAIVDDDDTLQVFMKELSDHGYFQIASACFRADQALAQIPSTPCEAIIMDIRLPDMSGVDCASKLRVLVPDRPIIMLTGYPDGRNFFRSLMGGVQGFLVKPVVVQELLDGVKDVLSGGFVLGRQAVPYIVQLIREVKKVASETLLTPREEEVLACVFEGKQDKEIASTLGIGTATVHTHMHRLFEKLGVHSRLDILARYLKLAYPELA